MRARGKAGHVVAFRFVELFAGAAKRFRHTVVSGDIGLVKPDPAIFAHTLEKLGNPAPGEVFFIDDSEKNITAADALGFRTHHFRSAEGLEAALMAEGLL